MNTTNAVEFTTTLTLRAGFDIIPGLRVTHTVRGAKQGDILTTADGRQCVVSKGTIATMVRQGQARRV